MKEISDTVKRWVHDKRLGPNDFGDTMKIQKGVIWPLIAPTISAMATDIPY